MTNGELESLLRGSEVPAKPADYWAGFPEAVVRQIRSRPQRNYEPAPPPCQNRLAAIWVALLLVCATVGAWLLRPPDRGYSDAALAAIARESWALFPDQLNAVRLDRSVAKIELLERPEPQSAGGVAVVLKSSDGELTIITKSGHQVTIGNTRIEVLARPGGGLVVVGDSFSWSSGTSAKLLGKHFEVQEVRL